MSSTSPVATLAPAIRLQDLVELTKLRLIAMVGLVTAAGYALGAGPAFEWGELATVVLGMLLVGAGGSAFNQILEIEIDRRMPRTAARPLVVERVAPNHALALGSWTASGGLILLLLGLGPVPALLALLAMVLYVGVYTPLKSRSVLNTWVGAVPGALPVVVGFSAAGGDLRSALLPALALFAILFLWQIPHFFAIAWLYREQYAQAGLQMLPVHDPSGRVTAELSVAHAVLLVPCSVAPWLLGLSGPIAAMVALVASAFYFAAALRFRARCDRTGAKLLLRASLLYLPVVFLALVAGAAR